MFGYDHNKLEELEEAIRAAYERYIFAKEEYESLKEECGHNAAKREFARYLQAASVYERLEKKYEALTGHRMYDTK